jgi:hypothetical protein
MENNSEYKKEVIAIDFNLIAKLAKVSGDLVRKVNKEERKNELITEMLNDAKIDRELFLIKWENKTREQ